MLRVSGCNAKTALAGPVDLSKVPNAGTADFLSEKIPLGVYILLSKLTAEGRKTVQENPSRIQEVNKEIEAFGAKVLSQYATLGPYDFVNIVDAPDNQTIAKVSVELGSRGTIEMMTLPALTLSDFVATIKTK